MKIIGIIGKLSSGKTTFAKFLNERLENSYILSFAGLLKEMILKSGLCSQEELWGKKTDFSRLMLQKIGTDIIRNQIDENFWTKKMKEKIYNLFNSNGENITIIIDDVRFKNEANFVKEFKDSTLLRIERPSLISTSDHRSETEQDEIKVDFTVKNIGSLEELKEMSYKLLEDI